VDQLPRQRRQPVGLVLGPTVFDRQIPAFDIARLFQSLAKSAQRLHVPLNVLAAEKPDHRHRRLLRPRRHRPRSRRAEKRDELAAE
jgi:hypothetical protein